MKFYILIFEKYENNNLYENKSLINKEILRINSDFVDLDDSL